VWLRLGVVGLGLAGPAAAAVPPSRIVSLNVCLDQLLVELVPRARIAAVTHLATDPLSVAEPARAHGLRQTRGAAEDVLSLDPDLVLAGAWSTPATVHVLRQLGRRVEVVAQPDTIAGIRALVGHLGTLVAAPGPAAALVARMDARIAAVGARLPAEGRRPSALVYQPNDYVSSTESLIGEALRLAGFADGRAALAPARSGRIGLESLLLARPDVLVLATGPATYATAVADNLRHPALQDLALRTRVAVVPWPLWLCGTHHVAAAVERLAALHPGVLPLPAQP
jgi:iron complex transport system substrate-binding protein